MYLTEYLNLKVINSNILTYALELVAVKLMFVSL